jgi:hypothetical protein
MDELPEFEVTRRDFRELVDLAEARVAPALGAEGASWLEACARFVPLAVRLIADVQAVIPLRFAKALVASSYIAGAKTVPGRLPESSAGA